MKTALIPSISVIVALFAGVQPAGAESWSLDKPSASSRPEEHSTIYGRKYTRDSDLGQSPLEKLNAGTKKFFTDTTAGTKKLFSDTTAGTKKFFANTTTGTKRFFAGVKDTFSWNKPAPRTRQNPFVPWLRQAEDPRKHKRSWIDSLFGREEPKQVDSLKDWVGLPRPEF